MDYLNTQYTCTQILSIRNSAYSTFLLKINCCFLHIIIPVYCLSHTFVFNNCCDLIITCNLLKWLVSQDFSVNLPKKSTVYQMVDFIIFLETVNFVNYVHWSQIEDEFHFILYVIKAHLFCASQFIAFPFYCIFIKFIFLLQAQLICNRKTIDVLWSLIISS